MILSQLTIYRQSKAKDKIYFLEFFKKNLLDNIDPMATNPGVGEFDTLTGGEGKDRFLLGDSDKIYYSGEGNATIGDFNSVDDTIVLSGVKTDYSLSVAGNVTSIFLKRTGQADNLIATVQGPTDLNLDRPYFTFI